MLTAQKWGGANQGESAECAGIRAPTCTSSAGNNSLCTVIKSHKDSVQEAALTSSREVQLVLLHKIPYIFGNEDGESGVKWTFPDRVTRGMTQCTKFGNIHRLSADGWGPAQW